MVASRERIGISRHTECAPRQIHGVLVADGVVGYTLPDAVEYRVVRPLHVQRPRVRIVRGASPPRPADGARHDDRTLQRRWRENRPAPVLPENFECSAAQLRRKVDQIVLDHLLPRERRRPAGHRLRGRRALTRHVARGHRTFGDWPDRFSSHAIEHVHPRRFRRHHHDVARSPLPPHCREHRWRGQVVIPQTVVHDLIVPDPFAGAGVERHHRFREQIVALAVATVPVVGGRTDRQEQQTALGIEAHRRPHVCVPHVLVRTVLPRVPAKLARIRNRLEGPDAFARAHVKRLHVTRRVIAIAQPVTHAVSDDHDVAVDNRWGRVGVVQLVDRPAQPADEIHLARLAKARDGHTGACVQRNELPSRIDEDTSLLAVRPRCHAAMHEPGSVRRLTGAPYLRVVLPQFRAGARVQRSHRRVGRRDIHRVANHHRRRLKLAGPRGLLIRSGRHRALARAPRPRDFELAHVGPVHRGDRRPPHRASIATWCRPVGPLSRQRGRAGQHGNGDSPFHHG